MNTKNMKRESTLNDLVNPNGHQNYVSFKLDQQTYAFPVEPIVQIIEMVTITPIPQVNPVVKGVINVRGEAVPVVDLRRHLGLSEKSLELHTPIILISSNDRIVGMLVDEVMDVLNIATERVAHTEEILPEGLGDSPILRGLIHTANGVVLLLDVEQIFSSHQAQDLAQVLESLPPESVEAA